MARVWTKIDDVIDNYATGDTLRLAVDGTTVFTNSDVYSVLSNLYDTFAFRHRDTVQATDAFIQQYNTYRNDVGNNYFRMYDALNRKYNPISNYDMTETSADGRKISTHTTSTDNSFYEGNEQGGVSNVKDPYSKTTESTKSGIVKTTDGGTDTTTQNPYETTTVKQNEGKTQTITSGTDNTIETPVSKSTKKETTGQTQTITSGTDNTTETPVSKTTKKETTGQTSVAKTGSETSTENGNETDDRYVNAFDSGISDTGTHSEKNVKQFDNRTNTTTYTDRKDTTVYGADGKPLTETTTETYTGNSETNSTNNSTVTVEYGADGKPLSETTTETYTGNSETNTTNNSTVTVEYGADGTNLTETTTASFDSIVTLNQKDTSQTVEYGANASPLTETVVESISNAISERTEYSTLQGKTVGIKDMETGQKTSVSANDYHTAKEGENNGKTEEKWGNDVSISYKSANEDGTFSDNTFGSDFSDGTMHVLTRSGNIGVTTNAQMIQGEIEMRRINLLHEYVQGFITLYCSFVGVDE